MEVSECLLSLKQKTTSRYIAEQLKNSVSTVIVDYRGLTVAEVTELRSQLREAGVEYKVYKNTMVRRAAEQAGIEGLDEFLTGPTASQLLLKMLLHQQKLLQDLQKNMKL